MIHERSAKVTFTIITDTSANLPTEILKKRDILTVPLEYSVDNEYYICKEPETFDEKAYYAAIRKGKKVKTSQITPERCVNTMKPVLERGEDILMVCMSSGVSGGFNSATLAAKEMKAAYPDRTIRLVDSLAASLGLGLQVIKAADLRDEGMGVNDVADWLEDYKRRIYQVVYVDDLMHLKQSGRVSGAAAVFGTMLGIKPVLKGNSDGQLVVIGKERGSKKALQALVKKYEALVAEPEKQIVGIMHADCEEGAKALAQLLMETKAPKEILTVCMEPVVGAHTGPGTVGLFFAGNDGVREQ